MPKWETGSAAFRGCFDYRRLARLYQQDSRLGVAADCAWSVAHTVHGRIRAGLALCTGDWRRRWDLRTGNLVCVVLGRTTDRQQAQGTTATITAGEKAR